MIPEKHTAYRRSRHLTAWSHKSKERPDESTKTDGCRRNGHRIMESRYRLSSARLSCLASEVTHDSRRISGNNGAESDGKQDTDAL